MTAAIYSYVIAVVRNYLVTVLPSDVRIATKIPADKPTKLVVLTSASTGGGTNLVLSPRRVIIHCYDPDETICAELAETVYGELNVARHVPGNGIRNVVPVGTPARYDDPDDASPRFQMTLDILLRANK